MEQSHGNGKLEKYGLLAGILILSILLFYANYKVPFMMDDLWYSTNLKTNNPLRTVGDVWESQIWHFFQWGGRCITHGLLQLILMTGERVADVLNVTVTLLLVIFACRLSGRVSVMSFFLIESMFIAMTANLKMSMLWQAGAVNYVYAGAWILLFLIPYADSLENRDSKGPFLGIIMIPLGFFAGWSNENMGILCFGTSLWAMIHMRRIRKKKIPIWMVEGCVTSFLGALLVILAPGNFVRSASIEKTGILTCIRERFLSMLQAGSVYLFPVFMLMTILTCIVICIYQRKLCNTQIMLLLFCILSFGAMVLSPHYPDRASFGSLIMGCTYCISLINDLEKENKGWHKIFVLLGACYCLVALIQLLQVITAL